MSTITGQERRFLFLQGPHGPFFWQLGRMLRAAGAKVWRVGFNKGDEVFWRDRTTFLPFSDPPASWPDRFTELLDHHTNTDIAPAGWAFMCLKKATCAPIGSRMSVKARTAIRILCR